FPTRSSRLGGRRRRNPLRLVRSPPNLPRLRAGCLFGSFQRSYSGAAAMLVLFETPAGFALFKVLHEGKVEDLWKEFTTSDSAKRVVELKAF
ncbi:unnamed protein product, partial [Urochloa humidicola]